MMLLFLLSGLLIQRALSLVMERVETHCSCWGVHTGLFIWDWTHGDGFPQIPELTALGIGSHPWNRFNLTFLGLNLLPQVIDLIFIKFQWFVVKQARSLLWKLQLARWFVISFMKPRLLRVDLSAEWTYAKQTQRTGRLVAKRRQNISRARVWWRGEEENCPIWHAEAEMEHSTSGGYFLNIIMHRDVKMKTEQRHNATVSNQEVSESSVGLEEL